MLWSEAMPASQSNAARLQMVWTRRRLSCFAMPLKCVMPIAIAGLGGLVQADYFCTHRQQ
jgi:hypothetical protein